MTTHFKWNGVIYEIYWDTVDGKRLCRVKVINKDGSRKKYSYCFRTKRAAERHIIASNPIAA